MHHPCFFAHVQFDELATERMVEHNLQNLAQPFSSFTTQFSTLADSKITGFNSTTEYTEHTESFLRRDSRVERVETCSIHHPVHQSYTVHLMQKGQTLLRPNH